MMLTVHDEPSPHTLDRRRFLQLVGMGVGAGALLGPAAFSGRRDQAWAAPIGPTDGIVVLVGFFGGFDGLNTVVPFDNADYYAQHGSLALAASQLLPLGPHVGLHPSLPFSHYTGFLRALKSVDARLQLKCFTAIEILHLAWLAKKSVRDTLTELKEAGLESLTGGGAEIFRKEIRQKIARGKESAEEYLDVHRTWHALGGRSTCTMLYGHLESHADRVHHLSLLRGLQEETRGFTGFIPLPYQPENNGIPVKHPPTGAEQLRTLAVARLFLDNFDHITAYWIGMGMKLAQVGLGYGADDLHGTIVEEHIFHMAGAQSPQQQTEQALVRAIREAGRIPVQRNTFYEPIRTWEPEPKRSGPVGDLVLGTGQAIAGA